VAVKLVSQLKGKHIFRVKFQVLMAGHMKITALWEIEPCSLTVVDLYFGSAYCLHHQKSP
jgi:hypothetical protein